MTATKQFIEDAWSGGYQPITRKETFLTYSMNDESMSHVLLDPLAWQAVGKTRGWSIARLNATGKPVYDIYEWHRFIDHLADGLTIEEALGKLST
jgi:hypothetical protein